VDLTISSGRASPYPGIDDDDAIDRESATRQRIPHRYPLGMPDESDDDLMRHLPLSTPQERGFALDRVIDAAVQEVAQSRINALGARMGLPPLDWQWEFNSAREVTIRGRSPHPPLSDQASADAAAWVQALGMDELEDPLDGMRWAYSRETYWEMRVEWVVDVDAWNFATAARHEEDDRAEAQWAITLGRGDEYFAAIAELDRAVHRQPGIGIAELMEQRVGEAWRASAEATMGRLLEVMHRAARIQEGPGGTWWPTTKGTSGPPYRRPTGKPIIHSAADDRLEDFLRYDVDYRTLRHKIPTLGGIDMRLWKLVGGDNGGTRSVYFGSTPHTVMESHFTSPHDSRRDPSTPFGWTAYVSVESDVILRAAFPNARYSHDDVPARAALHALAMYYWQARSGTHPRWKTVTGALRFLKPDLEQDLALKSLDSDIRVLRDAWRVLATNPRGEVNATEEIEMRMLDEFYTP
jgi:hypothetical protein